MPRYGVDRPNPRILASQRCILAKNLTSSGWMISARYCREQTTAGICNRAYTNMYCTSSMKTLPAHSVFTRGQTASLYDFSPCCTPDIAKHSASRTTTTRNRHISFCHNIIHLLHWIWYLPGVRLDARASDLYFNLVAMQSHPLRADGLPTLRC